MARTSGNSLSGKAAIVGIGETDYLRGADQSILQMVLGASMSAIKDAGLKPSDIDAVIPPPGFVAWDEIAAHLENLARPPGGALPPARAAGDPRPFGQGAISRVR